MKYCNNHSTRINITISKEFEKILNSLKKMLSFYLRKPISFGLCLELMVTPRYYELLKIIQDSDKKPEISLPEFVANNKKQNI